MSLHRISRTLLVLLAGATTIAHAGPLSFNAALDIAERQSPMLAANRAEAAAAQSLAIPAGALPDPKLFVGIDNYPVSGPDRGQLKADNMTMQKFGVMQEFPNRAKRQAREDVASATIENIQAQRQVDRIKLREATALAWLDRYYAERKIALFDSLDKENQLLAEAVHAQIISGRSQIADSVMPKQEAAQLADRRDDLMRDLAKSKANLRRYVGTLADDPLVDTLPVLTIDPAHLRQHVHSHPALQAFVAETHKAQAEVREAQSMKKSDWGVELAYQRRDPRFGNMVSLQFTFDIPVSPSTRQNPQIAAKEQALYKIDADREAMLRDHTSALESKLADYAALTRQLARAYQTTLPLAQQKIDLQYAAYRAGKSDLTQVLAARRDMVDSRLNTIALEAQQMAVAAQLYFAYGDNLQ